TKEQVAYMLMNILKFREEEIILDATDGLAAALCHYFQNKNLHSDDKSFKSWKEFINKNPERIS
ncbi:MAG TPA: crossover junction endodeoxyribonuclease RuvC, partial [Bacteroidales bacterium]|nr:crossover junction endodeoxyribonuclease RuvC [Bacteroidales bacterium]